MTIRLMFPHQQVVLVLVSGMRPTGQSLRPNVPYHGGGCCHLSWILLSWMSLWAAFAAGMTNEAISTLRQETRDMFYHGYDNYMKHAFPEDALRPLTCTPLTRDRQDPANTGANDVLGNYSLTLIDSLSTLAIIASSDTLRDKVENKALRDFHDGITLLVENYGDGTPGPSGEGSRARGFDLDSKVQVFETVIRGVGGLLSAHQFAVGDLPIRNYDAKVEKKENREGIFWSNGFVYDGQLLRLATDLTNRLMPAFHTPTGLPYPRVNLRYGIPFFAKSQNNMDAENGQCSKDPNEKSEEVTETCSAGAGTLVLEFSTLSRLTGNPRYERLAHEAFWAVWQRRTTIGLIGAGIDSETGEWVLPYTGGIGAGTDSFFEYSLKSHILLSGLPFDTTKSEFDPSQAFLDVWNDAHEGIKRHVYRGAQHHHPHYAQVDLFTGAIRAFWMDSLSAFYQGLLTLAGKLNEAIETHLLFTALWTRYSAIPERWSIATGNVEHGFPWWGGRPEWIESTWYLYQATKDPWYLHAGEMALRDIKRRCWTKCGWAGLQDVRTGQLNDHMESFFLGETVKYLYLLFDPSHPLNTWDAPFVFTTEGHPLIIPQRLRSNAGKLRRRFSPTLHKPAETCPLPPAHLPFSISATAARADLFHAASLARLHMMPTIETLQSPSVEFSADHPSISVSDLRSPSNYTYYPWTLPPELIPHNATSSVMAIRTTFDLSFPATPNLGQTNTIQRVRDGILVTSMSGLRLGMVREHDQSATTEAALEMDEHFRVYAISNIALGRDEKVFMSRATMDTFNPLDPYFTRTQDAATLDLVVDVPPLPTATSPLNTLANLLKDTMPDIDNVSESDMAKTIELDVDQIEDEPSYLSNLLYSLQSLLSVSMPTSTPTASNSHPTHQQQTTSRHLIAGTLPIGPGAAFPPETLDPELYYRDTDPLTWSSIYIHSTPLCDEHLTSSVLKQYQVLVVPRGECSFTSKMRNIPALPESSVLQLVVVVSFSEHDESPLPMQEQSRTRGKKRLVPLVQPYLDDVQYTPSGVPRESSLPLIMVGGGEKTMTMLKKAGSLGIRRRYYFRSQGVRIDNLVVL